jgi:hypothetical protein
MKRQRIRREAECIRELPRGHTLGSGLNQEPKHGEAMLLSQRGQSRHGIRIFHISMIIEI